MSISIVRYRLKGNRIDRNLFFLSCARIQSCHKIGDSRLFKDDLDITVVLFRTLEWQQLVARLSGISVDNLLCSNRRFSIQASGSR